MTPPGASAAAPRTAKARVLLVEPYDTGSHAAWLRGLRDHSRHDVRLLSLPGRFWKWRMHGGALTLARRLREQGREAPDVVLASDMLDLAAFLSLARPALGEAVPALYMHENQLAYPSPEARPDWDASRRRRAARRDEHYPFLNLSSALCAHRVFWNSAHNRDSFLEALPGFLGCFPDYRELGAPAAVAARSEVLPLGLDLASLEQARAERRSGPPRIVWNHRWEHDKDPAAFFRAVRALAEMDLEFELVVLGERFGREPPAFSAAREVLGSKILRWGYAESRAEYAAWLWQGDIVVSTALHEFFGAALCEAVACGCLPLAPRRLSYPELFPASLHGALLYDDETDLVRRLAALLRDPQVATAALEASPTKRAAREAVWRFDWSRIAPRYDDRLADLAGSAQRDAPLW